MDITKLQEMMIGWAKLQAEADALKGYIEIQGLKLGKSIKVEGARCTYSKGRKTYDYKGSFRSVANSEYLADDNTPSDIVETHSEMTTAWRSAYKQLCRVAGVKEEPSFMQSEPTAKLKL